MKQYTFGVAVFPDGSEADEARIEAYLRQAHALGCGEVFSSLHIPELGFAKSLAVLGRIAGLAHAWGMQVSLDVSGAVANTLLNDEPRRLALRALAPDWVRMDFGFDEQAMLRLVGQLGLPGLMLNASVLTRQQVEHQVKLLRARYPNLQLRGHHNYYPLPESGLSLGFAAQRARQYAAFGIPVTACVAAHHAPRLPLACGLPTVETTRTLHPGEAALQLVATGVIDDVLIGDPFASEDELAGVALACRGGVPVLRVQPEDGATAQERQIAFAAPHHARPDEAAWAVRSQTSREMAAPGQPVPVRPAGPRLRGDVMVCNRNALRYSGELQVLCASLPATPLQNLVGRVIEADLWKLGLLCPGSDFSLKPVTGEQTDDTTI